MIICDVNVYLYALNGSERHHAEAVSHLTAALGTPGGLGVLDETLASTVRIATHPRLSPHPLSADAVLDFVATVREAAGAVRLTAHPGHWREFTTLVSHLGLRGNEVRGAWLAAQAMVRRATLLTFDRGLRRFPGLDVTVLGGAG